MRKPAVHPACLAASDGASTSGLKALFTMCPFGTVEVFVPELLAQRGKPASVIALQTADFTD